MGRPCDCCEPSSFICGSWSTNPRKYQVKTWPTYVAPVWTDAVDLIENPTLVTMWLRNWRDGSGGAIYHRLDEEGLFGGTLTGIDLTCPCQVDYSLGTGIVGYGIQNFLGLQFRNQDITGTRDAIDIVTLDSNFQPAATLWTHFRTNPGRLFGPLGRLQLERVMVAGSPQVNIAYRDPDNTQHYRTNIGIAWPSLTPTDYRMGIFGYGPCGALGITVQCNQTIDPIPCYPACLTDYTPSVYYIQPAVGTTCPSGFGATPFSYLVQCNAFGTGTVSCTWSSSSSPFTSPYDRNAVYQVVIGTQPFLPEPTVRPQAWVICNAHLSGAVGYYKTDNFDCTAASNTFTFHSQSGSFCTIWPGSVTVTLDP